jgi:hypothetical protein
MRFIIKIITPFLIFSIASCSFLNNPHVEVTIDSDPAGAKIYIDNVYYGNTTRVIKVVPDKNHNLRLEKDGYETVNIEMKTRFSMRKGREGASKCRLDLVGWFLIAPLWGLTSFHCRSFTEDLYNVELSPITVPQQPQNFLTPQGYSPPNYSPFSTRNYYWTPQSQPDNAAVPDNSQVNGVKDNQNISSSQQPIFNNQSEFINNGNEFGSNQNFNRKSKIDYYNWQ